MNRQNRSIYEIEEKIIKTGPNEGNTFWSVKTDKGLMSIFDSGVAEKIKKEIGKVCDIVVETKGQYTNITAFNGAYGPAEEKEKSEFGRNQESKDASMMVSYAKDLVITAISRIPMTEKMAMAELDQMMESAAKAIGKAYKVIKTEMRV